MIAAAMKEGISRVGDHVRIVSSETFHAPDDAETAVFYGFDLRLRAIFDAYRRAGRDVVYVDLGYWARKDGGPLSGYHKVSVNGRHPTAYFQAKPHDATRAKPFRITIEPWHSGDAILLAGMSGKGAISEGLKPEEWERSAAAEIRKHSDRPIIYRPKPSWKEAGTIPGTVLSPPKQDLAALLKTCHAVVTHHSNVAIDGIIKGVPAFCVDGVATVLAGSDLSQIESPPQPDGREEFLNDLAWCQWSAAEIRAGMAWRHLKNEGLVK